MAKKLKILIFPDPRLRKVAKKVTKFDKSLQKLADDMLLTMYDANGIGLAATQVNQHLSLIVMDLSEERTDPKIFVNPTSTVRDNNSFFEQDDGCLSIPVFIEKLSWPDKIELMWQDLKGNEHIEKPEGLLTVCIQHEIDHLEGKLMVDYVSGLKRERVRSKLLKEYNRK